MSEPLIFGAIGNDRSQNLCNIVCGSKLHALGRGFVIVNGSSRFPKIRNK